MCVDYFKKPQLVLLDHGFYTNFNTELRLLFCELWAALAELNYKKAKEIAKTLGIEKHFELIYRYLQLGFCHLYFFLELKIVKKK